jgi:hypothetical protein
MYFILETGEKMEIWNIFNLYRSINIPVSKVLIYYSPPFSPVDPFYVVNSIYTVYSYTCFSNLFQEIKNTSSVSSLERENESALPSSVGKKNKWLDQIPLTSETWSVRTTSC